MSKEMWQLNATFASSQPFKKRVILSPERNVPFIRNVSLLTLCPWDLVVDALPLSDNGSSPLAHLGLVG